MSTVKSRLKEVMDAIGIDKYTPASTCEGITKSMLQNLWNSSTDTVTSNVLEPFCKTYPQVSCTYLLKGEGPMFENNDGIQKSNFKNRDKVYNIWMKFMEITGEMQELYKEENEVE